MTVSTHTYSAVLVGTPDVTLRVKGGQITLDEGSAPHVRGSIDIATPGMSVLTALDPRNTVRIRLTTSAAFPSGAQGPRVFNLALRSRPVRHARNGYVTLDLASDEALLGEIAPLAADVTPRASETSLRAVVNYVLNKAIPGAALAATPSNDANITRYWSLTNLIPNPSGETNATNWSAGTSATAPVRVVMGSPVAVAGTAAIGWNATAAGDSNILPALVPAATTNYPVTPGRWYVFTGYICSSVSRLARAAIQWWSAAGTVLSSQSFGSSLTTNNTAFQRVSVIAQAPSGASHAVPYVNTQGNAAGNSHYFDCAMFYEGDELVPYFDGATASAGYTTAWSNTAHGSTSTRTPTTPRDKESLTWRAGQTALDFLHPLVQAAGFRLVCDESRVWTLRDEAYTAGDTLSVIHGINLIDGTDIIDRDTGLWFDAQVTRYTWNDTDGISREVIDSYALTATPSRVNLLEVNAPYPGPGRSQYAVRRAQGRGREVTVTTVADWRVVAEQTVSITLENAPLQLGEISTVRYDLDTDRMTITTRTTDIPAGAISLSTGDIQSATGNIQSDT